MAEQLLEQIRDVVDGQIDFEGQRLCDWLAVVVLSALGAISFLIGYLLQDIKLALFVMLGGTALSFVVIIPPWPSFNKHPVKWLPLGGQSNNTINIPQTIVFDQK